MWTFKELPRNASLMLTVVSMEDNLEYLTPGRTYRASKCGADSVRFTNASGAGTYASAKMLDIFTRQGRIQFVEAPMNSPHVDCSPVEPSLWRHWIECTLLLILAILAFY